jgi:hypothetical protein
MSVVLAAATLSIVLKYCMYRDFVFSISTGKTGWKSNITPLKSDITAFFFIKMLNPIKSFII